MSSVADIATSKLKSSLLETFGYEGDLSFQTPIIPSDLLSDPLILDYSPTKEEPSLLLAVKSEINALKQRVSLLEGGNSKFRRIRRRQILDLAKEKLAKDAGPDTIVIEDLKKVGVAKRAAELLLSNESELKKEGDETAHRPDLDDPDDVKSFRAAVEEVRLKDLKDDLNQILSFILPPTTTQDPSVDSYF
ncbi:hypothetical protein HK097_006808 [Rhizophlyctis rosea]|uniref:Uncharacterized protein n=1 Tax=Rhizophlyctis rosea TaxID=64517 RepID=A0AAD5SKA1_9FUNG|nr:hypothetical protein HK097_006808 [Rhizophlyctis rosea]